MINLLLKDTYNAINKIKLAIDYKLLSKEIFENFDKEHPYLKSV